LRIDRLDGDVVDRLVVAEHCAGLTPGDLGDQGGIFFRHCP